MPRIKISGITNTEDAKWAAILGVEFISVSLEENSDKKVSLEKAKDIKAMLPSYTSFIAEFGANAPEEKTLKKLDPGYIQVRDSADLPVAAGKPLILETDTDSIHQQEAPLVQINLSEIPDDEKLKSIKERFNMEKAIIHGDWELSDIKRVTQALQPFAWSIGGVIERSPRKIDYNKMKQYIREISLI
jgi:phosphoribosylanthranilate isomerase